MMAASSAFSALSSELSSNAASYESIISSLSSQWTGPSSTAMAASAQTYIEWLTTTSAQLQEAAAAATSSAAAYEAAYAATIPPAVVYANRAQLAALVATNILGQNTPAILANEAMYAEFWAQDAAAMYGYSAAASAASSGLTPLTDPEQAMDADAPQLHLSGNVLRHVHIRHGEGADMDAEVWVEGYYETAMQDQAALGPDQVGSSAAMFGPTKILSWITSGISRPPFSTKSGRPWFLRLPSKLSRMT